MIRPNASGIIALMTDKFSLWDWAIMKLIRKSVGHDHSFHSWFVWQRKIAISKNSLCSSPFPAFMEWNFYNFIPESLHRRVVAYDMGEV